MIDPTPPPCLRCGAPIRSLAPARGGEMEVRCVECHRLYRAVLVVVEEEAGPVAITTLVAM